MAEIEYVLRTIGGPFEGQRIVKGEWPPVETLPLPPTYSDDGEYRIDPDRVSRLKDEDMMPGLIRGAEYVWMPK